MKDFKFVLIILLIFFGVGIMSEINDYDYNDNNTGIMYQENDNIVLNENKRYYDYNINYNLDESYLHYWPVKKGGLLDNYNEHIIKRLNTPIDQLNGYTLLEVFDLGNLIQNGDFSNGTNGWGVFDGNIIFLDENGVSIVNKNTATNIALYQNVSILENHQYYYRLNNGANGEVYFYINNEQKTSLILGGFNLNTGFITSLKDWSAIYIGETGFFSGTFMSVDNVLLVDRTLFGIELLTVEEMDYWFNQYQTYIEILGGTSYIPPLKIDFKGTNQIEYINPFEEQIIQINDINNVNNIEFELLNTKNSVVFNWNIKTNKNIPFIKFYNDETKLLYDFTDIDEINRIGNNLVASQSNFIPVINNVLDIVDMFYTGFQKLFNNDRINTIIDFVKDTWPLLPPNLPLIPIIKGVFS